MSARWHIYLLAVALVAAALYLSCCSAMKIPDLVVRLPVLESIPPVGWRGVFAEYTRGLELGRALQLLVPEVVDPDEILDEEECLRAAACMVAKYVASRWGAEVRWVRVKSGVSPCVRVKDMEVWCMQIAECWMSRIDDSLLYIVEASLGGRSDLPFIVKPLDGDPYRPGE